MSPRPVSVGAGDESSPDRRGAPWQSAGSGARSSGDPEPLERPDLGPTFTAKIVLRPYNPISWFHPRGIKRVLARLTPRLPKVGGCLFLTFTLNPALFADPSSAFEWSRQRLRRVFFALRRGVSFQGRSYAVDAPYAVKVEFHASGWAHFHVVFLTRRFLPAGLLAQLWPEGRTEVQRISNDHFRYLLKYVTKDGTLPEWVLSRKRLRVFQASRGFLKPPPARKPAQKRRRTKRRAADTLGERIERQKRTALLESDGHFAQVRLGAPFEEIHQEHILRAAEEGRYLGQAHYQLNAEEDLRIWTNQIH